MEKTLASPQNNLKTMTFLKGIKQVKPILWSVLHKPIIPFKALPRVGKKDKAFHFHLLFPLSYCFHRSAQQGLALKNIYIAILESMLKCI